MAFRKALIYSIGGIGLAAILVGLILQFYGNDRILYSIKYQKLPLRSGSESFKNWQKSRKPLFFGIYIFNITNPNEVNNGAEPILSEMGPYVYDEWIEKVDVKEEPNDTLSYREKTTVYFNEKLSGCYTESDMVTTINIPFVAAAMAIATNMPMLFRYMGDICDKLFPGLEDIFVTSTVKNLLFDGVKVIDCTSKEITLYTICYHLEEKASSILRKDGKFLKFSLFHDKNQTSKDVYSVYRGIDDLDKVNKKYKKNNKTLPEGPDLMEFEKVIYRDGVKMNRKVFSLKAFENSSNSRPLLGGDDDDDEEEDEKEKEEKATADEKKKGEEGKNKTEERNKTKDPLSFKIPIVVTFPHYYMANESYSNYTGLKPEKELHQSYFDIEPVIGIPLQGSTKTQISIEIRKISDLEVMSNLSTGIIPVVWAEHNFGLDDEDFEVMKSGLFNVWLLFILPYILFGVGACLLIAAFLLHAKNEKFCFWEEHSNAPSRAVSRTTKIEALNNRDYDADSFRKGYKNRNALFEITANGLRKGYNLSPSANELIRNRRNPQSFRRYHSNVISYIENFM